VEALAALPADAQGSLQVRLVKGSVVTTITAPRAGCDLDTEFLRALGTQLGVHVGLAESDDTIGVVFSEGIGDACRGALV
jgi:hypothetical protein